MSHLKDLTGQRFGKWTVIDRAPTRGEQSYWNCICDCKTQVEVHGGNLRSGISTQCLSCSRLKNDNAKIHGKKHTKVYKAWDGMKQRCLNPNDKDYKNYGGRGIKIYPEWINNFIAYDMWRNKNLGPKPGPGYTIDRIDNDGDYWPGNLRWATKKEQRANQRHNYYKEDISVAQSQ